jgi:hypothetical protein
MKNMPAIQSKSFVPEGGLDLVTPVLLLKDGVAFDASNWECDVDGGVSRIGGYDRYVSGATPSEQDFRIATVTCFSGTIPSEQILTGRTSQATMRFAAKYNAIDPTVEGDSVDIVAGDSNTAIYVTNVLGQFVAGEMLDSTAGASLVLDTAPTLLAIENPAAIESARVAAEAALRPLMNKPGLLFEDGVDVPGLASGHTLGVFVMNDVTYVVKAQNPALTGLGNTDNCLFLQPLGNRGWEVALDAEAMPAAGARFEFALSNIHAPALPPAIYGISNTSKAFMFDGSTITYITTGMSPDIPNHMAIHAGRLFLAYGGSLQYCGLLNGADTGVLGDDGWLVETGAGEASMGEDITGLLSVTGENGATALLVSTKNQMSVLYGASNDSFQLVPFSDNTGALPNTLQWLGQPLFQSAFGLTAWNATQKFGGFIESSLSAAIKPFVDARRGHASASMVCRDKNQYRVFYDDGRAIFTTFRNGKSAGSFTEKLRHKVTCAWSCVLSDNTELMLIGTQDGGLYKMDVGSSFSGLSIPHHIRFAFNHLGSPRTDKHFKRSIVEIQAQRYVNIQIGYDLDYGDRSRDVTEDELVESIEGGVLWDDGNWDQGYWDGAGRTPVRVDTPGTGSNISIRLKGDDKITSPFTLSAVIIDYIDRKHRR